MIDNFAQLDAKKIKIFSDEDIKELRLQYLSYKRKWVNQFYNIFHAERIDINPKSSVVSKYSNILSKSMNDGNRYSLTTYYFLRYLPGSFTTTHRDNNESSNGFTSVTLIDEVNLKGGESLLFEAVKKPEEYNRQNIKGPKMWEFEDPWRVPVIIQDFKIGDTLIYNQNMKHGVAKVLSGERVVLIAWFKNEEVKND